MNQRYCLKCPAARLPVPLDESGRCPACGADYGPQEDPVEEDVEADGLENPLEDDDVDDDEDATEENGHDEEGEV